MIKMFNMRNNEEIAPINKKQLEFLKKTLLKPDEDDSDFFINPKNIKTLELNAKEDYEKEIAEILRKFLEVEPSGYDFYYE